MPRAPDSPDQCSFAGHEVTLTTPRLLLRPTVSSDFDIALQFYLADPELREGMEGNRDAVITRDYLERASDYMSRRGFLFTIVHRESGRAVGEVCLEWMNLSRAIRPDERVMRSPIGLWDRSLRGQGLAREAMQALIVFARDRLRVDRLCAMDVSLANPRSLRLFLSLGYAKVREVDGRADLELAIKTRSTA